MSRKEIGRRLLLCLIFGAVCLLRSDFVSAGPNWWTPINVSGGPVTDLAIDPISPATLYASTDSRGTFKSVDGGAHWTATDFSLRELRWDPVTPTTLYGADATSVYRSTDRGLTWNWLTSEVRLRALAPGRPAVLYGSNSAGLFRSLDGGLSWQATGLTSNALEVWSVVVHPSTPATLYAAVDYDLLGVYKSLDGGDTWRRLNLNGTFIYDLAMDPLDPSTLFASGWPGGTYKSSDGGSSWRVVTGAFGRLQIAPANPQVLYLVGSQTLRTIDGGEHWAVLPQSSGIDRFRSLAIDPSNSAVAYAGTAQGVFKSADGFQTRAASNDGLTATVASCFASDPVQPATLYAETPESGIFKSPDAGVTWQPSSAGLTSLEIEDLVVDPAGPNQLYAVSGHHFFTSSDSGATWHVAGPPDVVFNLLTLHPVTTGVIYAGTAHGVQRSADRGATWQPINAGLMGGGNFSVYDLDVDPQVPTTLYISGCGGVFIDCGVYKSENGGNSWQATTFMTSTEPLLSFRTLALDPITAGVLYFGTGRGLYKSSDRGEHWAITPVPGGVMAVTIDPVESTVIYAGTTAGTFRSMDGGGSWEDYQPGLPLTNAACLIVAAGAPDTLYMAASSGRAFTIQRVFALTAIHPPLGLSQGGTIVTLRGEKFAAGAAVTMGGVPAAGVRVVNSTTMTAVTPSHAAGPVDVVVAVPGSPSATLPHGFVYADHLYTAFFPFVSPGQPQP